MMIANKRPDFPFCRLPGRLAAAWLLLVLGGCYGVSDPGDLRQFVQEANARPVGNIAPLPAFKPYESFLYRATSLRGPFEPLVKVEAVQDEPSISTLRPDFDRPKEPLEAFKLESLSMVGSIKLAGSSGLSALIRDADGVVHRVQAGNHIGRNFGEIVEVHDSQLDVVEIVPDGRGGWMKRPRNLVLQENSLGG